MTMKALKWQDVDSSNVSQVAYDEQSMILAVRFIGGGLYSYDGVGEQTFITMANSASVGRYLNQSIKGLYPYVKHNDANELYAYIKSRREQI